MHSDRKLIAHSEIDYSLLVIRYSKQVLLALSSWLIGYKASAYLPWYPGSFIEPETGNATLARLLTESNNFFF